MKNKKIFYIGLIFSIVYSQPIIPITKIIACGIPKCGSNLLGKLITKITKKIRHGVTGLTIKNNTHLEKIELERFNWENKFLNSHTMAFAHNIEYFERNNFKVIFIYRDPRDQIISMMHVKTTPLWKELYAIKDNDIFLQTWITDTKNICHGPWNLPILKNSLKGIDSFYDFYLPWLTHKFVYSVSFEKLIGSKGGGSDAIQLEEIINIARYLEYPISLQEAQEIARDLHGNTPTFREGKIGGWRDHFKPPIKALFKAIGGELLIKLGYETNYDW